MIPLVVAFMMFFQTATTKSFFVWFMEANDYEQVQSYRWRYYLDGNSQPVKLEGVTCVNTQPYFQCSAPMPAFRKGQHSIRITAVNSDDEESPKPRPYVFTYNPPDVPKPPTPERLVIAGQNLGPTTKKKNE